MAKPRRTLRGDWFDALEGRELLAAGWSQGVLLSVNNAPHALGSVSTDHYPGERMVLDSDKVPQLWNPPTIFKRATVLTAPDVELDADLPLERFDYGILELLLISRRGDLAITALPVNTTAALSTKASATTEDIAPGDAIAFSGTVKGGTDDYRDAEGTVTGTLVVDKALGPDRDEATLTLTLDLTKL